MPSIFTLEGPRQGLGETAISRWVLAQNPAVTVALSFGLALGVGFVLSSVAVKGLEKATGK